MKLAITMSVLHGADPARATEARVSDTERGSVARDERGVKWFAVLRAADGEPLAYVDSRHETPRVLVRGLRKLGLRVVPMLGVDLGPAEQAAR